MRRDHGRSCSCARCRHARFEPGPPTSGRRLTQYGHFSRKFVRHRQATITAVMTDQKMPWVPRWLRRWIREGMGATT